MHELAARLARDVDAAFPQLLAALQNDVYSGMRRLTGNRADAEDLAQETFLRAYRALKGYPPARIAAMSLRGWIWTIALNLSRNHARDRARRPLPLPMPDQVDQAPEAPDSTAWDRRLKRLPPAARKAVVLRHVVGLTYAELAEALGKPAGTVKADVHRGIATLRQIIEEE